MIGERKNVFKVDKILVGLYILLVGFGWGNILSSSLTGEVGSIFNISELYGKQLVFILTVSINLLSMSALFMLFEIILVDSKVFVLVLI